jgi:hypothetical protein
MKKLSIENVKKLSKLEMKRIMAGSDPGGGGGGGGTGGGGGGGGQNDCNGICYSPGTIGGNCAYVCTYCYAPAGTNVGRCQA